MSSNYNKAGTDLDSYFEPIGGSSPGPDTGYKVGGVDLSHRYFASLGTYDRVAGFSSLFKDSGGNDLRQYFRALGYDGTPSIVTITPSYSFAVNEGDLIYIVVYWSGDPSTTLQWRKNGTDISGETSDVFFISSAATGDGATYTVYLSNSFGNVTSSGVVVVVHVNPYITTQPTSISHPYGTGPYALTVIAGGDGLTYQWYKYNGSTYDPLTGATGYQHVMNPYVYTDIGTYYCRVGSSYGAPYVDSDIVTVNVT